MKADDITSDQFYKVMIQFEASNGTMKLDSSKCDDETKEVLQAMEADKLLWVNHKGVYFAPPQLIKRMQEP